VDLDCRALFLLVVLFVGPGFTAGQTPTQSAADPAVLTLRTALDKLSKAKESKTRFTYFDLNHLQNFNEKEKKYVEVTQLFEVTYIGDLQYSRLMEVNGKPLEGKELKKEQERYDQAIRDHLALDDSARAKIQHREMKHFDNDLSVLRTGYQISIIGHEGVNGRDCVLVDALPETEANQKHFRIWIDPDKEEMLRLETTLLADEGEKMSGSRVTLTWIFIDDIPLISETAFDTRIRVGKKQVHVVSDHTYSRFRKFSVTTTIVPVEPGDNQ
jgi:hypothetical protein